MSMLLMVKAMHAKVGNPLRKLVLIKLADNANDAGECWPSYQHIADQCEISRRSVITHINKLEEMGFLRKTYRKGTSKPNSSNMYTITFDGESPALSDGESPAPRTSHSLEPVNEPDIVGKPDTASKVIEYLNQRTGSKFRAVHSNTQLINARLKEGYSLETVLAVIDRKCAEWLNDPKMSAYLRPGTLFTAKNFNNYAGVIDKPVTKAVSSTATDLNDTSWVDNMDWTL